MILHRLAVAEIDYGGVGDNLADADPDGGTDLVVHLVEKERGAQGQAELANHLKESAVLATEADRQEGRFGGLD